MKIVNVEPKIVENLKKMEMGSEFLNPFLNSDFLVIEEKNNEIIGVAGVGGLFHVGSIFVEEKFRGTGISSKLNLMRNQEVKKRKYSFFIGTTSRQNPNAEKISKILKERSAKPIFSFSYGKNFVTTIYIQEFNWIGKFVCKLLSFFNYKFSTLIMAILLKISQRFWKNFLLVESSQFPKIDICYSVKNFHKI